MKYCECHCVLTLKQSLLGLKDEVVEFIEEPSLDELSDIAYSVNRLVGSLTNKPYVKIVCGDARHIAKIKLRMQEHGCIRSVRHLRAGVCPSA